MYTSCMRTLLACTVIDVVALLLGPVSYGQKAISFPTADGGVVSADVYGAGDHGVVLAHGGRFNKGSWKEQAQVLAAARLRVLAIDFRGYGQSRGPGDSDPMSAPLHLDGLRCGICGRPARRPCRWSGPVWAAARLAMHRSCPSLVRLIVWCSLAHRPTAPPRSSKHLHCSLWLAMMPARMGSGSLEFARSMKKLLSRKN